MHAVSFGPAVAWAALTVCRPASLLSEVTQGGDFLTVFLQYLGNLFSVSSPRGRAGCFLCCPFSCALKWWQMRVSIEICLGGIAYLRA